MFLSFRPTTLFCVWLWLWASALGHSDEPAGNVTFRRHVLNADSEFSAAGVMDVNLDGRLDIVCGAWWYESPTWTKHLLRHVPQIRGRYDDYSNLTVDVDGDGWCDLVSVNYRSQSLYWCRHPGQQYLENIVTQVGQSPSESQAQAGAGRLLWEQMKIDEPGRSETGRLVDIDGDGQWDVLPAGTDFAAWYEFQRLIDGVRWLRHDLPEQLIGHGIGAGDIDGDGRTDLVCPRGWAQAPADVRSGKWQWHPDFQLAHDCGLPILCWDVDGDGDNDLVWGRGHDLGLYWTEQRTSDQPAVHFETSVAQDHPVRARLALPPGATGATWVTHAIDTSWSSAHTLLQADIDGDGRLDLVAGKRFQGHDGRDVGENDPLAIFWYRFLPATRTWQRHLISYGGSCGIDLDSVCADLDGDGDIDIVAPSRCGLHWLENVRSDSAPAEDSLLTAAAGYAGQPRDFSYYLDQQGQRRALTKPLDHGIRRHQALWQMEQVMGALPDPVLRTSLEPQVQSAQQVGKYWRIHLTYAADRWQEATDRVTAWLLVPVELTGQAPAMLCLHQTHFELGKGEPCGLGGNPNLHVAHELAQRGYVCLAPDYPGFGEYQYSFGHHADVYVSGTMKGIWNHMRAVDLLQSLPCVDRDAIGVIGHSLGGHNALFVAAFDQRLRCAVTSCGFNAFEDYYQGDLTGWTSPRYMPRIAARFGSSPAQMPFDFPDVLAAIAPRPVFVNAPLHDSNFAVVGVRKCQTAAQPLYQMLGTHGRLVFDYPDAAHDFPELQRTRAYEWLDQLLKKR
ncbi:MAG: alpha/beta fold hydrolase [Pirellulaceae bacterium]|nr:alpha/beta fold hydrolase [Pirellulaceae bacterium]